MIRKSYWIAGGCHKVRLVSVLANIKLSGQNFTKLPISVVGYSQNLTPEEQSQTWILRSEEA
jgi:hypothetical protein